MIEGDGLRPTVPFSLPNTVDHVTLDVQPGSRAEYLGGTVLLGLGAVALFTGYFLLLHASAQQATTLQNDQPHPSSSEANAGEVLVLGSLLSAAIGIPLVLGSRTHVQSSTGAWF